MFFIQVSLSLPRPLFPSILSSSNNFLIDLALTCPKYCHFLSFIVGTNELVVFAISSLKVLHWLYVPSMILLTARAKDRTPQSPLVFPAYDLTRSSPSELRALLHERLEQAIKYMERNVHKHTKRTRLFVSNTKF